MTRGKWKVHGLPRGGAVRVNVDPYALPALTGWGRYDDPDGEYRVRYVGGTLECCLKEQFDRFGRASPTFEATLAQFAPGSSAASPSAVDEEEDDDLDQYAMPPGADPRLSEVQGWLSGLRVGRLAVATSAFPLVDHETVLGELDEHPRVRQVLDAFLHAGARLTQEILRRTDDVAYRVTQAVSSAVHHDEVARYDGVAYRSCVDKKEECWGVYDRTPVEVQRDAVPLLLREHEPAIRAAAAFVGMDLSWLALEGRRSSTRKRRWPWSSR